MAHLEGPVTRPMPTEVIERTDVPVDQGILATSLQANVECMLEDRSGRGHSIADLLNEGGDIFYEMCFYITQREAERNVTWLITSLRNLAPSGQWEPTMSR